MQQQYKDPITYRPDGRVVMEAGTGNVFSSERQPAPYLIKQGMQKRKALKELIETPLGAINGSLQQWMKPAAEYLGKQVNEVTLADIMHFRIAQKAIQKQDVFAYVAVLDRAFGKPENKTTIANDEERPVPLNNIQVNILLDKIRTGQTIELPTKSGGVGEGFLADGQTE